MSRYRVRIEFQTRDGEQRRVTFMSDMNGLWWVRREEAYADGQWARRRHEQVSAPTVEVQPVGAGSFAGP